ncbi:MAG: hypothetical protein K2Y23_17685 [Cyanobacteria bacterium]|nr:hypothetical protein [Cyanobacteriota bacterium]
MRYLPVVVLLFPAVVTAESFALRPVDVTAAEVFDRAAETSEVVRSLIAALESSNVIVHIQTSRQMPSGIGGMTRFVTNRGGYRYLRITIATELRQESRIAILAHELQHAGEIAASPAGDLATLRLLFQQCGKRDGNYFETRAAQRIERLVRQEQSRLRGEAAVGRRADKKLEPEPVVKFHH